jgi:hypothetical protein
MSTRRRVSICWRSRWALMVWVYVWLVQMLWRMEPQAWMFLAVISVFNLILDFVAMLGSSTSFSDVSLSFLINAIILIYCMLPGTKALSINKSSKDAVVR